MSPNANFEHSGEKCPGGQCATLVFPAHNPIYERVYAMIGPAPKQFGVRLFCNEAVQHRCILLRSGHQVQYLSFAETRTKFVGQSTFSVARRPGLSAFYRVV